jgi:hypothetical protein
MRDAPSPRAAWLLDEDDDGLPSIYPIFLRDTAHALARRLDRQAARLRVDGVTTEEVVQAIKRQIAACVVDDPLLTIELAELLIEVLSAEEHARGRNA